MAGIYQAAWRTVSCLILHLSFHCKHDFYYHSTSQKEPDFTVSRLSFKLRQRLSVKFEAYGQHIFQITSSWNPQSYQPSVYCIWVLPTSCKDAAITLDVAWREVRGTHSSEEPPCKLQPLPDWCLTTSGQNFSSLPTGTLYLLAMSPQFSRNAPLILSWHRALPEHARTLCHEPKFILFLST